MSLVMGLVMTNSEFKVVDLFDFYVRNNPKYM